MCGIAGIFEPGAEPGAHTQRLKEMVARLSHRGPDDNGVFDARDVTLGHSRLAIIDLSSEGHQPMRSASGRYVLTYNGEVYNFKELSETHLSGHAFRGGSDTEVLLALIEKLGLPETVCLLKGMFAFALWDVQLRELKLARDRMGEKPLYYATKGNTFYFASELKAFPRQVLEQCDINKKALALYLRYQYTPGPQTIFTGVNKLSPGHYATVGASGVITQPYWRWQPGSSERITDAEAATDELERRLQTVIRRQMISDVPLGAFLSGGIDSSLVVSFMQELSSQPVQTFSIGFHEKEFNEADSAKAVANHLGTQHHEYYVGPQDALDFVPKLAGIYSEPFADPSAIPTNILSRITREQVTVALSGDGGDELFGGYDHHRTGMEVWARYGQLPSTLSTLTSWSAGMLSPVATGVGLRYKGKDVGTQLSRLQTFTGARSFPEFYRAYAATYLPALGLLQNESSYGHCAFDDFAENEQGHPLKTMLLTDAKTFMSDDVLVKVDRAGMSVGLESRIPLLDVDIVEFAGQLSPDLCIRGSEGKWLLRKLLYRRMPRELVDRPKMGFGVPVGHWMRNELLDWSAALVDPRLIREQGMFDERTVSRLWLQHQKGTHDWSTILWSIIMFQSWWAWFRESPGSNSHPG